MNTSTNTINTPLLSDWKDFLSRMYTGNTEIVKEWFREYSGDNIGSLFPWYTISKDPVYYAVETDNIDLLDVLLENGFSPDRWQFCGGPKMKPVHYAAMNGHLGILMRLIDHHKVPVDTLDSIKMTPLMKALIQYQGETARFLLSRGASVNGVDHELSPLVAAVGCRDVELLEQVLAAGADVNLNTSRWGCALNRAVLMRRLDLVKVLCEGGARTDIKLRGGCSILHIALAYPSDLQLIKYLIEINTSIYAVTDKGYTPVHYGLCEASSENVIQWLSLMLEAGHRASQEDYAVACDRFTGDEGAEIMEQLKTCMMHPRTLQQLCCFAIRRILGARFSQIIDCLPIPLICKRFLRLEHLVKVA